MTSALVTSEGRSLIDPDSWMNSDSQLSELSTIGTPAKKRKAPDVEASVVSWHFGLDRTQLIYDSQLPPVTTVTEKFMSAASTALCSPAAGRKPSRNVTCKPSQNSIGLISTNLPTLGASTGLDLTKDKENARTGSVAVDTGRPLLEKAEESQPLRQLVSKKKAKQ